MYDVNLEMKIKGILASIGLLAEYLILIPLPVNIDYGIAVGIFEAELRLIYKAFQLANLLILIHKVDKHGQTFFKWHICIGTISWR